MSLDGLGVPAGSGPGKRRGASIMCHVFGVAQEERSKGSLSVALAQTACRKLRGSLVIQPHYQVRRHDGSSVVTHLVCRIDACMLVAQPVEDSLEYANGIVVAFEREPRMPKLLPAIEATAHRIERVHRSHVRATITTGGKRFRRGCPRTVHDDLPGKVHATAGKLPRNLANRTVRDG